MTSESVLNSTLPALKRKNENKYILFKSKGEIWFIEIFVSESIDIKTILIFLNYLMNNKIISKYHNNNYTSAALLIMI